MKARSSSNEFGISKDESVQLIVRECLRNNVRDPKQIAYILGTAQHETANFSRTREIDGERQARRLGYEGGATYSGRGYVQLTHKSNYQKMDEALGLDGALVRNPSLASRPDIAAKILVVGMRDGIFTGKPLDRFIGEGVHDPFGARRVVNGVIKSQPETVKAAQRCVSYAKAWEGQLDHLVERYLAPASESIRVKVKPPVDSPVSVFEAQRILNALGMRDQNGNRLAVDGIAGPRTKAAIESFQREQGLPITGRFTHQVGSALKGQWQEIKEMDLNLVQSIRSKVDQLGAGAKKVWGPLSDNVSAALGYAAKVAGIDKADAVEVSKDLVKIAIIRGNPAGPGALLAYVAVKEAMAMPADASVTNMHDLGRYTRNVGREFAEAMLPQAPRHLMK